MKHSFWLYLLFICVGIVVGNLLAAAAASVPWLSWLAFGLDFGLTTPFVLNLQFLTLTFGFTLNLSVAVIICVILSLLLGRLLVRR